MNRGKIIWGFSIWDRSKGVGAGVEPYLSLWEEVGSARDAHSLEKAVEGPFTHLLSLSLSQFRKRPIKTCGGRVEFVCVFILRIVYESV